MKKYKIISKVFLSDFKYKNKVISIFINNLIKKGKINISQKTIYKVIDFIKKKNKISKKKVINYIKKSINNVSPKYRVFKKRLGSSLLDIPNLIFNKYKKIKLGIKNIIKNSKKRKEKNHYKRLSLEIIESFNKKSISYKKKKELDKASKLNKLFINN
ncbi:MAG: hypothetical protein ABPD24_00475 [Candidatus Shikimatogenerans sp. AspAUS03]|uniref:Small ribosomal subunit protein uS7 domain-containing protein n=1 Tax=Candidatus Shikimatogenerans sp. AspAUS03 TaxID=3158563 RepID=A0AAU7QUP2_9FLAO